MGLFSKLRPINFHCSLLIYTVSKERKEEDGENNQSVLSAVVNKVFERSGIRGLIINNRILEVFRKKIFRSFIVPEGSQLIEASTVANIMNFQSLVRFANLCDFNIIQFCIPFSCIHLFNGGVCRVFVAKSLWLFNLSLWPVFILKHCTGKHAHY